MEKTRKRFWSFWILMFAVAFIVLGFVGYSDGDDTYFFQYTHSMGFFEYLGWRYETWVGRMAAEALVYLTFHLGLTFWRIVNAVMLVLLPIGVIYLANRASRNPLGTLAGWKYRQSACGRTRCDAMGLGIAVAAVAGYFMMSAKTLGYAAVWVNGSIFYTWTFTCGIWALTTFADFVFCDKSAVPAGTGLRWSMDGCDVRKFIYAIPCAIIATMSIEQMAAVLLVFEVLGIIYGILKWRSVHPLLLMQVFVTLAAFIILFAAPGNEVRVATEIVSWMPQYETMTLGEHLFITVHWLLSSFANENKLFLCIIWIAGIMLILQKKERSRFDFLMIAGAGICTVAALLPYVGKTFLSDMGMQYIDIEQCVSSVPTIDTFSKVAIFAMIWWAVVLVYTFVFLWHVSGCQITLLLAYLAGIASEAIMFFSPTMYASGARVYYLTDILFLFVAFGLALGMRDKKRQNLFYVCCTMLGALNFLVQIPELLSRL